MIEYIHYIELWIDGQLVELKDQSSLNIRINNTLWNPTQINTKQGEYSYSFNIPSTPVNDKILNYANNLPKLNKFRSRYPAQVYADGNLLFDGSLTVKKYNTSTKMYNCNLVNIKIDTLEEIFGEEVLTDVKWEVDYSGVTTINSVNGDETTKYWFPLVCYGAFPKIRTDSQEEEEFAEYTSKYAIDITNRFMLESFYPSLNALEEIKKCFEYKGYSVGGNAFIDPILTNVYCSTNLADGQQPIWNLGNPKFGKLNINITHGGYMEDGVQDLKFPYFCGGYTKHIMDEDNNYYYDNPKFNFNEIVYYNLLKYPQGITYNSDSNMIPNDGNYIRIPADGFYRISMHGLATLRTTEPFEAVQYRRKRRTTVVGAYTYTPEAEETTMTITPDIAKTTPFEIQLVKNYDDNIELIKGKWNLEWLSGYPEDTIIPILINNGHDWTIVNNMVNGTSCYPHEKLGDMQAVPNRDHDLLEITDYSQISDTFKNTLANPNMGYNYGEQKVMCYDPVVSDAFICGWTTMGNKYGYGATAVIKNGYSWSKTYSDKNYSLYKEDGYYAANKQSGSSSSRQTSYNKNELVGAPNSTYENINNAYTGAVYCVVHLHKDDILNPMLIKRAYRDEHGNLVDYNVTVDNLNLIIEAITNEDYASLIKSDFTWESPTRFPTKLNLFEFTNKETKIKDWLQQMQDAFNLTYEFEGNSVLVNINKGLNKNIATAVDIDDRVRSDEVEAEFISYPKTMSVQYKIDTEEHGFYVSVPQDKINLENWKDFGESGYTVIKLDDDSYNTTNQNKQTQFSYTWYDNFTVYSTNMISIPVIEKEEFMIDGVEDAEAMAHRGYQLTQRFWFRQSFNTSDGSVWVWNDGSAITSANIYKPINTFKGVNLSYKDTEKSLLTNYFDIYPLLSSNYLNVNVFLNPIEYINIKNGALVHFDSDLYYTSEISGFDPSGNNRTKLKLVKKV